MKLYDYVVLRYEEQNKREYIKAEFQSLVCILLELNCKTGQKVHITIPPRHGISWILTCYKDWAQKYHSKDIKFCDMDYQHSISELSKADVIVGYNRELKKYADLAYIVKVFDCNGDYMFPEILPIDILEDIFESDRLDINRETFTDKEIRSNNEFK